MGELWLHGEESVFRMKWVKNYGNYNNENIPDSLQGTNTMILYVFIYVFFTKEELDECALEKPEYFFALETYAKSEETIGLQG